MKDCISIEEHNAIVAEIAGLAEEGYRQAYDIIVELREIISELEVSIKEMTPKQVFNEAVGDIEWDIVP